MKYPGRVLSGIKPTVSSSGASGLWTLQDEMQGSFAGNWPAAAGGAQYENLTITATSGITVTGSGTSTVSFFRTDGTNGWDKQAYCATPFTAPCTIEFIKSVASNGTDNTLSYAMIGWNTDPTTDASYTSLDYAAYMYTLNLWYVYHNGASQGDFGGWNQALTNYIVYATNGYIYHYNGSTLKYSVNYGSGGTVYLDSSIYASSATFAGFSNVRVIKKAWNGTTYA